jgi:uncharacterized membrane protein
MGKHINIQQKESLTTGEKISKFITSKIGTIGCAVAFTILACISLPAAIASHNALIIVSWLAQTFLQLVLLPIIMVGQNLQSRHSEYIADATYENDIEMHKEVDIMKKELDEIKKDIKYLINKQ